MHQALEYMWNSNCLEHTGDDVFLCEFSEYFPKAIVQWETQVTPAELSGSVIQSLEPHAVGRQEDNQNQKEHEEVFALKYTKLQAFLEKTGF